jgi:hypothetical protein
MPQAISREFRFLTTTEAGDFCPIDGGKLEINAFK